MKTLPSSGTGHLCDWPSASALQCLIRSLCPVAGGGAAGRGGQRYNRDQNRKASNPSYRFREKRAHYECLALEHAVELPCEITEWWMEQREVCLPPPSPAQEVGGHCQAAFRVPGWTQRAKYTVLVCEASAGVFCHLQFTPKNTQFLLKGVISFCSMQSRYGGESGACVSSHFAVEYFSQALSLHSDPISIPIAFQEVPFCWFARVSFCDFLWTNPVSDPVWNKTFDLDLSINTT